VAFRKPEARVPARLAFPGGVAEGLFRKPEARVPARIALPEFGLNDEYA